MPADTREMISVDMGCVGDGLGCTETQVSICAKDSRGPYHYRMVTVLISAARRGGADLAFVDGAVIVGTPFEARCDALILVTAPYETSVARICARDGIAPEMARRRLDAQTPLETLRAAATAELVNDSTPDALREKLRSVLNGLEKEGTCQKPKSEKEAF